MKFTHYCPTRVVFGQNQLKNILTFLPAGARSILLVSSKSAAKKSGALDIIKSVVEGAGLNFVYSNSISPNPRLGEVDVVAQICKKENVDCIISVGGGSVIDAAKFISVSSVVAKKSKEILKEKNLNVTPIFHIAVPTTAGTGSEVSKGAIVTDPASSWKGGLRGEFLFPKVAVLDPILTRSLPKSIALETGFDVLTHALETYVSKASTPITEQYSREAIRRAVPALILLAEDKATDESRSELMYSSLLAGYNLGNASTCLPHRLQYPLGAHTDCQHARGLAALYPSWISKTYEYAVQPFNFFAMEINKALKVVSPEETYIFDREQVIDLVERFLEILELNHRLRDFGVQESDCDLYTSEIEGNLALDPGKTDTETLRQIYLESF